MRVFKTPNTATDRQTLLRALFRDPDRAAAAGDLIAALNPDVDFTRSVPANSILFIPDAPELRANVGTAIGAEELEAFGADLETGLKAIATRSSDGVTALEKNHSAMVAALKPPTVRRIIDRDPQVRGLVQSSDAGFKTDLKQAKEAQAQIAEIRKLVSAEVAALRKLLDD